MQAVDAIQKVAQDDVGAVQDVLVSGTRQEDQVPTRKNQGYAKPPKTYLKNAEESGIQYEREEMASSTWSSRVASNTAMLCFRAQTLQ